MENEKDSSMQNIPANFDEQLDILIGKGFIIENKDRAIKYLKHIGFYRLSHYFKYFSSNQNGEVFSFENILKYYIFDRKLKLLLSDIIERIEVSVKANLINSLCLEYNDPHFFMNEDIYFNIDSFIKMIDSLEKEKTKNKSISEIDLGKIEAWKLFQGLTFGTTVFFYSSLSTKNKKLIASNYNFTENTLSSWLRGLTDLRNICAHYDKLWGTRFTRSLLFEYPKLKKLNIPKDSLFAYILIMSIFLHEMDIDSHLLDKIEELFNDEEYIPINKGKMGFEENWKEMIDRIISFN